MEKYYKNIIEDISEEFNVPKSEIIDILLSQFRFIKENIQKLPLNRDDITEEEFNKMRTSFNVPSIGKFYITYKKYSGIKKRNQYLKEIKNGRVQDADD